MQKAPYVFPIVGGRKVEHLLANLEALEITLTEEQIKSLESEVEFEPGFPSWFIVCCPAYLLYMSLTDMFLQGDGSNPVYLMTASGHTYNPRLQPLPPTAGKQ